jgi:hypothetical protein
MKDWLFLMIEGGDNDLGRLDIRRSPVHLPQLDEMPWLNH